MPNSYNQSIARTTAHLLYCGPKICHAFYFSVISTNVDQFL